MTGQALILGIDQGSTHTRAAVCDLQGRISGVGMSYGACHSIDGMEAALSAVMEAAQAAMSAAGFAQGRAALLYGGMTGADWPDEYTLLEDSLLALGLAREVRVVNDCIAALRGGTQAPYGAIVAAGTGANCAVLAPDGREFIYHYYVDDPLQGGSALGRSLLWSIYRAHTGRQAHTGLTAAVLEELGFSSVDALRRAQVEQRLSKARVQELAPLLFRFAEQGDPAAGKILRDFAAGLAELVTAGLRRFEMLELDVEVVTSGSIFKGPGSLLQDTLRFEINQTAPRAGLVEAHYEPVVGALLLGLQAWGLEIDEGVRGRVEQSSQKWGLVRRVER